MHTHTHTSFKHISSKVKPSKYLQAVQDLSHTKDASFLKLCNDSSF